MWEVKGETPLPAIILIVEKHSRETWNLKHMDQAFGNGRGNATREHDTPDRQARGQSPGMTHWVQVSYAANDSHMTWTEDLSGTGGVAANMKKTRLGDKTLNM